MTRTTQTLVVLAAALALVAPHATAQNAQPKPNGKLSLQATPAPAVRDDIQLVNAAILQLIGGKPLPEGAEEALSVPKSLQAKLRKRGAFFTGYCAPQISIMGYRHDPDQPIRIMMTEGLHLQDRLGRRMLQRLDVTYLMTPGMVVIEAANIEPWYPLAPRVRLYCVPAGHVPADLFRRCKKHTDLLAFLDKNAYSDQQVRQGWEGGPRSIYLVACAVDRLGPGAKLSVRLGLPNGKVVGAAECLSANYEGYAVAILPGKLRIPTRGLSANVYIKHGAYAPGDQQKMSLVGKFPLGAAQGVGGKNPVKGKNPTNPSAVVGLSPVADTHVYAYRWQNWNRANWGVYSALHAGWHPVGGEKRIYLKFDVSGVKLPPAGRAILRLYQTSATGSGALRLGLHRVTGAWVEGKGTYPSDPKKPAAPGEITWANQPMFALAPSALFRPDAKGGRYVEADITPLVRQWQAGQANHGLMIAPTGSLSRSVPECNYGFCSREAKDPARRPVLIIRSTEGSGPAGPKRAEPSGDHRNHRDHRDHADNGTGGADTDRAGRLAPNDPRVAAARDRFVAAQNKLIALNHAGKSKTAEYRQAYDEYLKAKSAYNRIFSRVKPPRKH